MDIDLRRVNSYSVEELAEGLRSGEYTYQDYLDARLFWDKKEPLEKIWAEIEREKTVQIEEDNDWTDAENKRTIEGYLEYKNKWSQPNNRKYAKHLEEVDQRIQDIKEEAIRQEELKDWKAAERLNKIEGYEIYKETWSAPDKIRFAAHLEDADAAIALIIRIRERERQRILQDLLTDMKENPWRYRQDLLRILFMGNLTDAMRRYIEERESDKPYAEFILKGYKLKMSDLYDADVVPKTIRQTDLLAPDYSMPATLVKDMGILPTNRTDVYFFGVPRSGKSSVLSGIIYKLWRDGRAGYEPQIVRGRDASGSYYQGLIEAIASKKPPQGTARDTVSCMKINLMSADGRRQNPITIVELSGEAFKEMSDRFVKPSEIWNELGASQCIANNNRKLMFFVLDYSIISDKNPENVTSPIQQIMSLETALNVFTNDGPDERNPKQGCTLSKVDTVAVIMTKCDLMNVTTHDQRLDLAEEYIHQNFRNFMQKLMVSCREFGINRANNYHPYILAFSLGDFYVGNTVVINENDPANIIEFISRVTRGENNGSMWSRLFNF